MNTVIAIRVKQLATGPKQYPVKCITGVTCLARKNKILLGYLLRVKMPPSKFEANLTLHVRKFASFSLFLLASSSSNDYFHTYIIIYFLANQLISLI